MNYTVTVNDSIKALLRRNKIFVQSDLEFDAFEGILSFDETLRIEPYVEIVLTGGPLWSMGTSSYSNQVALPTNTKVGRFCSIGPGTRSIPVSGHALERFTTSPITYIDEKTFKNGAANFAHFGYAPISDEFEVNEGFETMGMDMTQQVAPIVIGNDVWLGAGVQIKPGVTIGDGAVVGISSIVTKDVPPYTMVAGSPAVPRKKRFSDEIIKRLLELQWWKYPYWKFKGIRGDEPVEEFIKKIEKLVRSGELTPYNPEPVTAQMILDAGAYE